MRNINTIMLDLTTVCNRRCPECCCGMDTRKQEHYPWDYFENLAQYVKGIGRIDVTGGEPTCHPQFGEFVAKFRALFGCSVLSLETNCFRIQEYPQSVRLFDFIRIGVYPENKDAVTWLRGRHGDVRVNNPGNCVETNDPKDGLGHVSKSRRGSGNLCNLESREHVLYSEGKFWPCRLGPAIDGMVGIPPSHNWKREVSALPIPCENCYFSPDEAFSIHGKYVPDAD